MPTVPTYERNVGLQSGYQRDFSVRASADAFGADIGRGLQQAGQGLGQLSNAIAQVQEMEDIARAKEADNEFANWARERMYGEGGFLTLEGKNAIDARKAFEDEAQRKRSEFGSQLPPGAARAYGEASNARLQSIYQQSITHTAQERKTWFKTASASRIETFANDALANFSNPKAVTKNIGAGIMELREQAGVEGWDGDTLRAKELEFASGVHKNIALRMAQTDPLAANEYVKQNMGMLTGAHQYELTAALDDAVVGAEAQKAADGILSKGRVSDLPGDIVAEVAGIAPEKKPGGGPTRAKAFLSSISANKGRPGDTMGLQDSFAENLAAMIQDAPPEIRKGLSVGSGYRSPERQQQLWNAALKKYGSVEAARKWVAPPGRSQHNEGEAVDLTFNGQFLGKAPKEVQDWVHQNARKYGMYFPMGNEPWHIEPIGSRDGPTVVAPRGNTVAPRAGLPSFDEIQAGLDQIADPRVREQARKRVMAAIEGQSKVAEAQEKAARAELWRYIDAENATPDQVPLEIRQAAGQAAISSAWEYVEKREKREAPQDDEVLLYDLRRYAATKPEEFADLDLTEYRNRMSKESFNEFSKLQASALTDQRKVKDEGVTLTSAFSQAETQLEAVGLTTTGKKDSEREEVARRIAAFQNQLAQQLEDFKKQNNGKLPNQMETQSIINRMLLPVVIKSSEERSIWNPLKTPWSSMATTERSGFLFETAGQTGDLGGGTSAEIQVEYDRIPISERVEIEATLQGVLGRKPTPDEVENTYRRYLTERR